MSEYTDFQKQALAETLEFIGETITCGAIELQAIVSTVTFEEELGQGGVERITGATAIVQRCDLEPLPAIGEIVLYGSRRYRLMKIEEDSISYELVLATSAK